jgi:anti-anti-sigma regulatory factor
MSLSALAQSTSPADPVLTPSWRAEGTATVIDLPRGAGVASLPALVAVLARVAAERQGPVVVDLAAAGVIDAATVRTLSRAGEFLDDHGRQLTLRSPSPQALRLLAFAGLSHLITPNPLRETAARAAHPSGGPCRAGPLVGLQSPWSRPDEPPPAA